MQLMLEGVAAAHARRAERRWLGLGLAGLALPLALTVLGATFPIASCGEQVAAPVLADGRATVRVRLSWFGSTGDRVVHAGQRVDVCDRPFPNVSMLLVHDAIVEKVQGDTLWVDVSREHAAMVESATDPHVFVNDFRGDLHEVWRFEDFPRE